MNSPLLQLMALVHAEPPARVWQSNPARDTWLRNVAAQQSRVDTAWASLQTANATCDRARMAAEQHAENPPENPITNAFGKQVQNPKYAPWKARQDELDAAYKVALQAANTAQANHAGEVAALQALMAQEPVGQVVVDNPAYASWVQQIVAARAVLEAARWDHLFDAEAAVLRAAAANAAGAWQQGVNQEDGLTRKLAEQRQLEPQLAAQVVTLTAAVQAAQQDADAWAAALQAAQSEERRLQAQEPPPRLTVHNPKWDEWQALMRQLQQAYDSRVAEAVAPEAAVTRTQAELDNFDRDNPEPEAIIQDPPRRPHPNPEHAEWVRERRPFVDARDAALAQVRPYRDAISRAYGDLINSAGTQPPTSIEVDNPAHAVWSDQLTRASLAVGNATLRANRAATALASAQAALAGPAANLALVRSLLATLPGELSAAQAAIPALVAARDSTAAALAVAELRVAVVLDQAAPDDAVVATLQALFQSLGEAEAELCAFEDEFAPTDDELWRLQARIGELQRLIAQAAADTQKVNDAEADYNRKAKAVQDKLNSRPRP